MAFQTYKLRNYGAKQKNTHQFEVFVRQESFKRTDVDDEAHVDSCVFLDFSKRLFAFWSYRIKTLSGSNIAENTMVLSKFVKQFFRKLIARFSRAFRSWKDRCEVNSNRNLVNVGDENKSTILRSRQSICTEVGHSTNEHPLRYKHLWMKIGTLYCRCRKYTNF